MLHLIAIPFIPAIETYYNAMEIETEATTEEKLCKKQDHYVQIDAKQVTKPVDIWNKISTIAEQFKEKTRAQQTKMKQGKAETVVTPKKEHYKNYCATLSQDENIGNSDNQQIEEIKENIKERKQKPKEIVCRKDTREKRKQCSDSRD